MTLLPVKSDHFVVSMGIPFELRNVMCPIFLITSKGQKCNKIDMGAKFRYIARCYLLLPKPSHGPLCMMKPRHAILFPSGYLNKQTKLLDPFSKFKSSWNDTRIFHSHHIE